LSLPEYVNDDKAKAKASYKDGLLTLTIPKAEKGKHKAININ
jgi:HSP20 family protein